MSGDPREWAAMELIRLAEDEEDHDGTDGSSYEAITRNHRDTPALHGTDYNTTNTTWSADKAIVRILRILEKFLLLGHGQAVDACAEALDSILLSYSAEKRHGVYLNVIEMLISAIKFVDGHNASMTLARLMVSLASRGDLVNTSSAELHYDLGDHGQQPFVISPGAASTGDGNLEIWSEMPCFQAWIEENFEREWMPSL
jgi:hypothetical protein